VTDRGLTTRQCGARRIATLGDHEISELSGCWAPPPVRWSGKTQSAERWTFRNKSAHGVEIVRKIPDSGYNERVRAPRDVLFSASTRSFAFGAAGQIHALMFIFKIVGDHLEAQTFVKIDEKYGYVPRDTLKLFPCER
jgi:hypothetical protein